MLQVIVAVDDEELPRLAKLYERGRKNGVSGLRMIGSEELRELEPYCRVREGLKYIQIVLFVRN